MTLGANGSATQPLVGITQVNDNDIICGRGGLALKHPGNMAYRKIVGLNKELYATCLKTEKLRISKSIVAAIREINARFVEREDGKTATSLDEKDANGNPVTWRDIGDKRAIEKTSQALREGQPKLLKKLAEQQDGGAAPAMGAYAMNGNYQFSPQHGNMQPVPQSMPNNMLGGMGYSTQNAVQNSAQMQQQNFTAQQRGSITLASLAEGQAFSTFPRNSFVERGLNGSGNMHKSWQDSWGEQDITPLALGSDFERGESTASQDSWGISDPTPLPYYQEGESSGQAPDHVFSTDDHKQLMTCLDVDAPKPDAKRPSVKFQLEPQRPSMSAMSLASHLSELSIFSSDALSLDSGMDAREREAEFEMLGDDHLAEMSLGTFESPESGGHVPGQAVKPRRSILRKSNKWTTPSAAFLPPAASNPHADLGLIFTSTMDTKPGGVNSGTDVSGLLGERRKSVVAFEIDVNRRRSSRMSMCSALTDFSGKFNRDVGSTLSIQSADFRDIMAEIAAEDEEDGIEANNSVSQLLS